MSTAQYAAPGQHFKSISEFYAASVYSKFEQEHRSAGSYGINMVSADQEPFDFIDASVPEVVIVSSRSSVRELLIDLGDGAQRTEACPGRTINIVPPNTEVRFRVTDPHDIMVLGVPEKSIGKLLDAASLDIFSFSEFFAKPTVSHRARRIMEEMWITCQYPSPSSNLYLDGLTLQLLALLSKDRVHPWLGTLHPERDRIARAIEFVEADLARNFTMAELARIACFSPWHFSRCFKAATGESPHRWIMRRRTEQALELIRSTRQPLAEIAHRCGFSSQSHMGAAVKGLTGSTPASLRTRS